jgi:hypothetical protein
MPIGSPRAHVHDGPERLRSLDEAEDTFYSPTTCGRRVSVCHEGKPSLLINGRLLYASFC